MRWARALEIDIRIRKTAWQSLGESNPSFLVENQMS